MPAIESDFKQWIGQQLKSDDFSVQALRNDASFRSYYRVKQRDFSYVVMIAPPDREKTDLFVNIANTWRTQALPVPQIFAWEKEKGYVLLSDFGDTLLLDVLNSDNVEKYYQQAIDLLIHLQKEAPRMLPVFDESYILTELGLFQEWYCEKLLALRLNEPEKALLESVNRQLVENCLCQPQVVIHRDYHSRNLMVLRQSDLFGLIDFQDAMIGPLTYDLVSILKDCYIAWPRQQIEKWAKAYFDKEKSVYSFNDFTTFLKWFDLTGLQRHLKVLGIFSRLKIRDHKPQYIHDMPRIMAYVLEVTKRYEAFTTFDNWLREVILPAFTREWEKSE